MNYKYKYKCMRCDTIYGWHWYRPNGCCPKCGLTNFCTWSVR